MRIFHLFATVALALAAWTAPAKAGFIKLTVNTYTAYDTTFGQGVLVEGDPPIEVFGTFQFIFDPSGSIAPTGGGVGYSAITATYAIGTYTYGGYNDFEYLNEIIAAATLYSYDRASDRFYFGSVFSSSAPGAPCVLNGVVNSHCGVLIGFSPTQQASGESPAPWTVNPGPSYYDFYHAYYTIEAVPEPSAWGLLLVGFGAIGGVIRRRARTRFA